MSVHKFPKSQNNIYPDDFSDDAKAAVVRAFFDASDAILFDRRFGKHCGDSNLAQHPLILNIIRQHPHPYTAVYVEQLLSALRYLISESAV